MSTKAKALGIALLGALALTAVAATGAQASFNSHEEDIVVTDIAEGTFTSQEFAFGEAPPISCNKLEMEGRVTGEGAETTWTTEAATLGFRYSNCSFEGEEFAFADGGCHFELSSITDEAEHANVKLLGCEENGGMTITINEFVAIHIPHQTIEGAVHYVNTGETGNGRTIDLIFTTAGIEYSCENAFLCELGGIPAEGTEGSYTGKVEIGAFEYLSGTTGSYEDGAQTDLWAEPGEAVTEGEHFHAHAEDVVLTGEGASTQQLRFKAEAAQLNCSAATLEGRWIGEESSGTFTAQTATLHPEYSGCSFGELAATVHEEGCHFELGAETDGSGHGEAQLKACQGGSLTITVPEAEMTIHVSDQALDDGVHYANEGSTSESAVAIEATFGGISYSCEPSILCKLAGIGTAGTEATLEGDFAIAAYEYESGTTGSYGDGTQVGFWHA